MVAGSGKVSPEGLAREQAGLLEIEDASAPCWATGVACPAPWTYSSGASYNGASGTMDHNKALEVNLLASDPCEDVQGRPVK